MASWRRPEEPAGDTGQGTSWGDRSLRGAGTNFSIDTAGHLLGIVCVFDGFSGHTPVPGFHSHQLLLSRTHQLLTGVGGGHGPTQQENSSAQGALDLDLDLPRIPLAYFLGHQRKSHCSSNVSLLKKGSQNSRSPSLPRSWRGWIAFPAVIPLVSGGAVTFIDHSWV